MIMMMMFLNMLILVICGVTLIYLISRKKTMECFYVEEENLYLNSLPAVKIPLSDIDYVEFYYIRIRISYRGQIKVHKKNGKVVKRFFQTSKISLSVTEQMILDEIDKLTPFFKKYYNLILFKIIKEKKSMTMKLLQQKIFFTRKDVF